MKLRNHILLWLIVTSVLPLIILSIAGNQYNQQVFLESVDEEMLAEIDRLGFKLDEQFSAQKQLLINLTDSEVVRNFGMALLRASEVGGLTTEFSRERRNLEAYFVSLQQLVAEDAELRLLDPLGHTVIKASFGQANAPKLETLLPYAIAEREPEPGLGEMLKSLATHEVSHRPLNLISDNPESSFFPDSILPMQLGKDQRIYLVFSHFGERLDKLLDLAPRLRNAKLTILDPDPVNHIIPMVLYDDDNGVHFSRNSIGRFSFDQSRIDSINTLAQGVVDWSDSSERVYFSQYSPYPDRFTSWLLTARLNQDQLLNQFRLAHWRMLALTAFVLLLSLSIAWLASRHLSRPICRLASNLHAYANNQQRLPDIPALSSEVGSLQDAYHDMTQSIETSQAQKLYSERKLQQSAKMASIGEMAAGIGHELNNPLTNIQSLGKLIKRQQTKTGENTEDIDSLLEETHRASRIVNGVLNFSRQMTPVFKDIPLNSWIHQCIQRVETMASKHQVKVLFNAGKDLVFSGDGYQLEQVLVNLLTNAVQASEAGQHVLVRAFDVEKQLVLQVVDNGEGVDVEIQNRLFEPFFTTREVGVGNGLGLSISMGIVQVHNGTLELRNNPAAGCTAEIRLPIKT